MPLKKPMLLGGLATAHAFGTSPARKEREPPDVVEDPHWLIATTGYCSNLQVSMKGRNVDASEAPGDTDSHFVGDISFNYYPKASVKFTDFPHHQANPIGADASEAEALVSPAWNHKNIALLEPTSTCSTDEQGLGDQAWGVSTFKVEEHRPCTDVETAWATHPCVHYTGYVSAKTSNFVNANAGRFVCQLFVDSSLDNPTCKLSNGGNTCTCPDEEPVSCPNNCCQFSSGGSVLLATYCQTANTWYNCDDKMKPDGTTVPGCSAEALNAQPGSDVPDFYGCSSTTY